VKNGRRFEITHPGGHARGPELHHDRSIGLCGRRGAAIDAQIVHGDVARPVGGEEDHGVGDVRRVGQPGERDAEAVGFQVAPDDRFSSGGGIRRVTAREMLKTPAVLTAKVAAQSSSVRDATEFMRRIPATFTRMRALVQANPADS
jgi:hypothetical protein